MQPVTCKITPKQREWLDTRIKAGEFASYGHSLRYLMNFRRKAKRVIANLKTENAQMRERIRLYEHGLLKKAEPED